MSSRWKTTRSSARSIVSVAVAAPSRTLLLATGQLVRIPIREQLDPEELQHIVGTRSSFDPRHPC
jgi:hypothetical protein